VPPHRPGRIILAGVLVIALVLLVVILLPLPSVDRELNGYIPTAAKQDDRSRGEALCAVTLTTTQDMAGVLGFYSRKLRLGYQVSARGGMTALTRGRLLGGYHSDTILPLSGPGSEAILFTHRDARHVAVIAVSRVTNEPTTHIIALLERFPDTSKRGFYLPTNAALAWPPPEGKPAGSGMGNAIAVAQFNTDAPFENISRHYTTNLLLATPVGGDTGLFLSQKREQGQAAFFAKPWGTRESIYVFCFKDNSATQTQIGVSWVVK